MAFLTQAELKTAQHAEIITAITNSDTTIVPIIIDESIAFMKGYLNARFDVDAEFAKINAFRNLVLLKILKAIVIYEIYSLHNPRMMTEVIQNNHTRAIDWLKAVQKEQINPDLAKPTDTDYHYIRFGSNTKRSNQY